MKSKTVIAFSTLVLTAAAVTLTGCSSSTTSSAAGGSSSGTCSATIGYIGPTTGDFAQVGQEQLHFSQYAIAQFNAKYKADIKLVQGDTQLQPAQAVTVAQSDIANADVVATVTGSSSQEITAMGPILAKASLSDVAGAAVLDSLTDGKFTSFFRVVPKASVESKTVSDFIEKTLKPKKVQIIDDQSSYSTDLASTIGASLKDAGITVGKDSVSQEATDFSSLASTISDSTEVVVLPWQKAAEAEQFSQALSEQGKKVTIVGTDGIYSPGQFTRAGSYVASFAPDITQVPSSKALATKIAAKYGTFGTYGPPMYAATQVTLDAIKKSCDAGKVTRESVLANIKKTNQSSSILGQPISFTSTGDLKDAEFFLFKIGTDGTYNLQ